MYKVYKDKLQNCSCNQFRYIGTYKQMETNSMTKNIGGNDSSEKWIEKYTAANFCCSRYASYENVWFLISSRKVSFRLFKFSFCLLHYALNFLSHVTIGEAITLLKITWIFLRIIIKFIGV